MSFRNRQSGFSAVELVIVVAVVGVLALVGYMVINRQGGNPVANTGNQQPAATDDVPAAPEIKSSEDLDKAESTLDGMNTDSTSDSSQLDSELNSF